MDNGETRRTDAAEIGHRLKMLRMHCDLQQKQVAMAIDTRREFISAWERGLRIIPADKLLAISRHFHVPLDYFHPDTLEYLHYLDHAGAGNEPPQCQQ